MTIEQLVNLHTLLEQRVANLEAGLRTLAALTGHNTDTTNARVAQLEATIAEVDDLLAEHIADKPQHSPLTFPELENAFVQHLQRHHK